jgi:signal transduction histidine kinase
VEVHYRDGRSLPQVNPFLDEEQNLIDNIAGQVAFMIEHEEARSAKAELREQLIRADRLAAIGQLAAGVAHELNEPLNTILGLAQLVRKMPGLPAQSLEDLDKITEASLHARSIIRELLIFARQGEPGRGQVNLNRIIMDELALFEALCGKSCVELRRIVAPDLPEITADKSQIRQVISNLVVNALQAMPGGGVLTLQTFFDASRVYLAVEDNGIGMSPEVKENAFMPFFTTKDVDQGTGLGLSVVHGIVSLHKGEIRVESEQGKGSRFLVTFPLRQKTAREEEPK